MRGIGSRRECSSPDLSRLHLTSLLANEYNTDFNVVKFDHFRMQAGLSTFTLSVGEWIEKTKAVGLYVERGQP